ncbi:MAG: hypothetical protein ACC660_01770 [Acidimicrobiales bacterium]
MGEFILDVMLPKTDQIVAIQWIVMAVVWAVVIPLTWRRERDIRHFVWGLAILNLAWFSIRIVH